MATLGWHCQSLREFIDKSNILEWVILISVTFKWHSPLVTVLWEGPDDGWIWDISLHGESLTTYSSVTGTLNIFLSLSGRFRSTQPAFPQSTFLSQTCHLYLIGIPSSFPSAPVLYCILIALLCSWVETFMSCLPQAKTKVTGNMDAEQKDLTLRSGRSNNFQSQNKQLEM